MKFEHHYSPGSASELHDILADTPLQVLKVPAKAMEMAVDGERLGREKIYREACESIT